MPPDLSDNQLRLMAAIRDSQSVQTTEFLGTVRTRDRSSIGADAARKVLGRLESRDPPLVQGEGAGQGRSWDLTPEGLAVVNELKPPQDGDRDWTREYVVLEELKLSDLLARAVGPNDAATIVAGFEANGIDDPTVYVVASRVPARNREHAFRQVSKGIYARRPDAPWVESAQDPDIECLTVRSVAVDGKRWQPEPVTATRQVTVSV